MEDQAQGHTWTRALQGIPANGIHLRGDQSALNVVCKLCDFTYETLLVKQYQTWVPQLARHSPGLQPACRVLTKMLQMALAANLTLEMVNSTWQ